LVFQIFLGRQTVTMQLKPYIVTSHLLLATLFLGCVLWMLYGVRRELVLRRDGSSTVKKTQDIVPEGFAWLAYVLPVVVFVQIAIGGFVASTYAGMICVDWPYCNGQWVPTLKGPMGLQIIHRFVAYGLVVLFIGLALFARSKRAVLPATLTRLFYAGGLVVVLQTFVGILNLLWFIPPHVTVLHQTLALILLAISLRISFDLRAAAAFSAAATKPLESLAAEPATLS
jgi:heme a synthase